MSLKNERAADIAEIIGEIGEPVRWNNRTFKAIITPVEFSDALAIGGFDQEYDFTVKIPKAALGNARPRLNDPIEFDDKTYRIGKVSESPGYPMIVLTVQSK